MFCCKCGKQIKDGSAFCNYCGAKVTQVKMAAGPERSAEISEQKIMPEQMAQQPVQEQPVQQLSQGQPVQQMAQQMAQQPVQGQPVQQMQTQEQPVQQAAQSQQMQTQEQPAPAKKSKKGGLIAGVIGGVAAAAAIGCGIYFGPGLVEKLQGEKEIASEEEETDEETETEENAEEITEETEEDETEVAMDDTVAVSDAVPMDVVERPSFLDADAELECDFDLVPSVEAYTVEDGLSNVVNKDLIYVDEACEEKLEENGFAVSSAKYGSSEFYSAYENNRYLQVPNFVTVDSLMHTYHLYYSYLLKNTELNYLSGSLSEISKNMLDASLTQYEELQGTQWESAAKRNVAFFAVGAYLQDDTVAIPDMVSDEVNAELDKIMAAEGISDSSIFTTEENFYSEDYSQYKPRGYYEGDATMEAYFRTMMWYGRMSFTVQDEDLSRSALLMNLALNETSYDAWEGIYTVTSFFAGASDDATYYEYAPLMQEAYENNFSYSNLIENEDAFTAYYDGLASLPAPQINSLPIQEGEDNTVTCYRFMGQRFTIDATVMQNLIYSEVGANSDGDNRMLPDVLDVAAALGSDRACEILEEQGDTDYDGYVENMEKLQQAFANNDAGLWNASLYASWLNTLRPLLESKGEGYPSFMQNEAWDTKNLETFAASYTELKHDTVLYSKQVMAEMGGEDLEIDDRGYVQPEPLVYARFILLTQQTREGLERYGMISEEDSENLSTLEELARKLMVISEKELQNETLTDEEYELIRDYGGNLEHFWYDAVSGMAGTDDVNTEEYPCPVVVDIATDPNGSVLEAATGKLSTIYVVAPVDGELKLCEGTVYSFYEFSWPMDDRLTDSEWRSMMGFQMNENDEYDYDHQVDAPEWTTEYRYYTQWD